MSGNRIEVTALVEEAEGPLLLSVAMRAPGLPPGRAVSLRLGDREIARLRPSGEPVRVALDVASLRAAADYAVHLRDESGADLTRGADVALAGPFFEALRVGPASFLDKVQLHHSRLRSRHLLEIAAHGFLLRHPEAEFVLRGAALTILGHRLLERPPGSLSPDESARVAWLLGRAGPATAEGAALVRAAEEEGRRVDWQHVRWTVSLATVAAHLALYDEGYERALALLGVATRHAHLVHLAKVSALNLVVCAFAEGLIASLLGRTDHARAALTHGVESVKPIVQAQNLTENVWVLGDLQNVIRAARQCYIALIRLGLVEARTVPPVIDDATQIDAGEVRGPLPAVLGSGVAPRLAAHLAGHGGR